MLPDDCVNQSNVAQRGTLYGKKKSITEKGVICVTVPFGDYLEEKVVAKSFFLSFKIVD